MRKMRRFVIVPATRPNSEINVTPLVDVVLVLLIIFMVVTPLLEKNLDVRVPDTEQVETPDEVPPDQLVVSLTADGQVKLNQEPIEMTEYVPRLQRVLAAKPDGQKLVFFAADGQANYAKLVAALDGAKAAGAETLGMMTEAEKMPAAEDVPAEAPAEAPAP